MTRSCGKASSSPLTAPTRSWCARSWRPTSITWATRHHQGANFFATMGGFAPTLGVIGTVSGLVHMLANLSDPGSMGPSIAAAFIATLYGVSTANLIFLPLSNKLKHASTEETHAREIVMEGILAIQAGDNPRIVEEKLKSFLAPKMRRAFDEAAETASPNSGVGGVGA